MCEIERLRRNRGEPQLSICSVRHHRLLRRLIEPRCRRSTSSRYVHGSVQDRRSNQSRGQFSAVGGGGAISKILYIVLRLLLAQVLARALVF
jgi:hypothetical protein